MDAKEQTWSDFDTRAHRQTPPGSRCRLFHQCRRIVDYVISRPNPNLSKLFIIETDTLGQPTASSTIFCIAAKTHKYRQLYSTRQHWQTVLAVRRLFKTTLSHHQLIRWSDSLVVGCFQVDVVPFHLTRIFKIA